MPRTPWARRRTTDSPRPDGRWAGRLRRSGSLARQVLAVRVGRRRTAVGHRAGTAVLWPSPGEATHAPTWESGLDTLIVAPVGPAPVGSVLVGPAPSIGTPVHDGPRIGASVGGPARAGAPVAAVPLLPGVVTAGRRLRFAIANGCTVSSLVLGMTAIFLAMHGGAREAALCLVGCVIFDGLDGGLARKLNVASPFGAQMDSLADMCSFGIAAPIVVYSWVHGSAPAMLVAGACVLVAACAAIRLARFNVSPRDGRFFCGVPTTMTAAVLGLATLLGLRLPGPVTVAAIALLGLAMVSSFPYAKLTRLAKLPPWLWLAPAVGLVLDYRVTFVLLVTAYLLSGPVLWLHHRRA